MHHSVLYMCAAHGHERAACVRVRVRVCVQRQFSQAPNASGLVLKVTNADGCGCSGTLVDEWGSILPGLQVLVLRVTSLAGISRPDGSL